MYKYDEETQTYPDDVFQEYNGCHWAGQQMFHEFPKGKDSFPTLWTVKDKPAHGLPSAYQVYMSCTDEYEAALKIAGSYINWEVLIKENSWFYRHLVKWREHMALRDASLAKKQIIKNTKKGQTAAANSLKSWSPEIKAAGRKKKSAPEIANPILAEVKAFTPRT